MMLSINIWMTLATIILIPIAFIIIRIITKYSQSYFLKQLVHKGSLNAQIEETFTGHDIIRAFNQEEKAIVKFEQDNEEWFTQEWTLVDNTPSEVRNRKKIADVPFRQN